MKLLQEFNALSYDPKVIAEQRRSGGKVVLRGILQKADTINQNNRIYPRAILEREVENYQKFIRERRSTGELDHPNDSVVNLKNVSHLIIEADMDNEGVVRGAIELLNTPSGQIAKQLVESGVTLGISSRAVGSTKKQGDVDVVMDDLAIVAFDLVSEPSTPNAFMMREGKELTREDFCGAFTKNDRVFRAANDFMRWMKKGSE